MTCGTCGWWNHARKSNCSTKEHPLFHSECLFPVESLPIPFCATFDYTMESNGEGCPQYKPKEKKYE